MDTIVWALLGFLLTSLSGAYFLLIWFAGAKFFIEYLQLFGIANKIPHVKAFLKTQEQNSSETYLEYIEVYKDNFLTRLVTCPKCFSFWICTFIFIQYAFTIYLSVGHPLGYILGILTSTIAPASAFVSFSLYSKVK